MSKRLANLVSVANWEPWRVLVPLEHRESEPEPEGDQNSTSREEIVIRNNKIQIKNVKVQIEGGEKTDIPCQNRWKTFFFKKSFVLSSLKRII